MYYYSNNYSKFIEDLKLEKSKKAFKDMVENTQEDKSEKIKINDVFADEKTSDKIIYQDASSFKENSKEISINNNIENKETTSLYVDKNLPDSENYSSIQRNIRIEETKKNDLNVKSNSVESGKNFENLKYKNEFGGKQNSSDISFESLEVVKQEDEKINTKSFLSSKEENEVLNNAIETSKENNEVKSQSSDSDKEEKGIINSAVETSKENNEVSEAYNLPDKNIISIIKQIKNEKKESDEINRRILNGNKNSKVFSDLTKDPQKYRNTNLERVFSDKVSGKTIEEEQYKSNSEAPYYYYPSESYYEMNSRNIGNIEDIFHRIVTPSNWNQGAGTSIANGLRIATDLIDIAAGLTNNIYTKNVTANNLRKDLSLRPGFDNFNEKKYDNAKRIRKKVRVNNQVEDVHDDENTFNQEASYRFETEFVENNKKSDEEISDSEKLISLDEEKSDENSKISGKILVSEEDSNGIGDNKVEENTTSFANILSDKNERAAQFSYKAESWFEKDANGNEHNGEREFESNIGYIYVCSPFIGESDVNDDDYKYFTIPLQNNLKFEQVSRAAAYNSLEFFGRLGDIQQYSRTKSLDAINLTTKYFVEDDNIYGNDGYNLKNLQIIENKYKSLVLPDEDSYNDDKVGSYTYFTKPPIINIKLGSNNIDYKYGEPYKNLFTNIIKGSDGVPAKVYYKNFVVTNISIDKNQDEYNFHVSNNNGKFDYLDTMGFAVTLTVLEIDENYLTSSPSFANYYNLVR